MKRTVLLFALLICTAIGFAQNSMPFILKYSEKGNSSIYHNVSYLEELRVDPEEYTFRTKNYDYKRGNTNLLDTIFIFQDHFKHLDTESSYWDDIVCSTEQIYFYKEDPITSKPKEILHVAASDTIPNGVFNYIVYDDNGIPSYINFNNEHYMYVERIYDHYADAIVLNNDSSFVSLDSIDLGVDFLAILNSPKIQSRSGYTNSNLQNATALLNHLIGGAMMAEGGIALLTGCAMLIPGVNIAAGATIAIAGAATFIAGGLLTVRATDQLVSDGSHSEGFDTASNILGAVGTMGASGGVRLGAQEITSIALDQTWNAVQQEVDRRAEFQEAYLRTKNIVENHLYTLEAQLVDFEEGHVRLKGNISRRLNNNDYWGIFICKDNEALIIEDVSNVSLGATVGNYECDFYGLKPTESYYYRAYYYASEFNREGFNPNFVASKKGFIMPGIKTYPQYEEKSEYSYIVYGKVQWLNSENTGIVGVCYSDDIDNVNIDGRKTEINDVPSGDFNITISPGKGGFYYRMYAIINDEVVYGDIEFLSDERSMLEHLFHTTNGDGWTHNLNWCKDDQPINKWYGVNGYETDNDRSHSYNYVYTIQLENNNLNGKVELQDLKHVSDLRLKGNNITSVYLKDCPNLDLGYSFRGFDGIELESLTIDNCLNNFGQHFLGQSETTIIDHILIKNHEHIGRVFFENIISKEIKFLNCKFDCQGSSVCDYDGSNVETLIFENCRIPCGLASGANNLVLKNTTIAYWVIEAKKNIRISNSTIEGHYISSFSGSQEAFDKYMGKLIYGY